MRGVYMKKIILAVTVISIAAFFVTCDGPITEDDAIVEYTDVVYSPDGSQVTVYLDGVTVPVTKAQRAINRDLAMMAYDFLEVVFTNDAGSANVARANWELGMPAGLYGVVRDSTDYALIANAALFAGKKSDKTLFGIGKIEPVSPATTCVLTADTQSVTFYIAAILTGLQLNSTTKDPNLANPSTGPVTNSRGVAYDSIGVRANEDVELGGLDYPVFYIPTTSNYHSLNYKFGMVQNKAYLSAAKLYGTANYAPVVQRRTPRFLDGGAYREPKNLVNTRTLVMIGTLAATPVWPATAPTISAGAAFSTVFASGVPLAFYSTTGATGYTAVYLEIPVYNTTNLGSAWDSDDDDDAEKLKIWSRPVTWYIRTGYGSELYSIDDGTSSGGCVLFSRGTASGGGGWLDIEWRWLPYTP